MILQHQNPELESETLRYLLHELPTYLLHSRSNNTVKSYASGFRKWKSWSLIHNVRHLPAVPLTFALFLLSLIQNNCTLPVIENVFYAVKYFHEMLSLPPPTENATAHEMLEVAKRVSRKAKNRKLPILIEHLQKLYNYLIVPKPVSLQNLRTFIMMLLSFTGFLRYDELVHIRYGDVIFHPTHIKIFIEKSKCDVYRDGRWVHIAATGENTCPLKMLHLYFEHAHLHASTVPDTYIFRAITKSKTSEILRVKNTP